MLKNPCPSLFEETLYYIIRDIVISKALFYIKYSWNFRYLKKNSAIKAIEKYHFENV